MAEEYPERASCSADDPNSIVEALEVAFAEIEATRACCKMLGDVLTIFFAAFDAATARNELGAVGPYQKMMRDRIDLLIRVHGPRPLFTDLRGTFGRDPFVPQIVPHGEPPNSPSGT